MKKIDIIGEAVARLKSGKVIAVPTETVYGLAVDAKNLTAISRLYASKQRSLSKPLVVAVAQPQDIDAWVSTVSSDARAVMDAFWPGPLTIILPRGEAVPDLITAGKSSIGLRCSSCMVMQEILKKFSGALCLTSANQSGGHEAITAQEIRSEFANDLFIVENDVVVSGIPTTIIDMTIIPYQILRKGEVTFEQIYQVLGDKISWSG